MDATPTSGPMTRARAQAIGTEVVSLLSQIHYDTHETWMLPKNGALCIVRYEGGDQRQEEGQVQVTEEGEREEEAASATDRNFRPTTGQPPVHLAGGSVIGLVQGRYQSGSTGVSYIPELPVPKAGTTGN